MRAVVGWDVMAFALVALAWTVTLRADNVETKRRAGSDDPGRHIGGVLYLYGRGMVGPDSPVVEGHTSGVFTWEPPAPPILALPDLPEGADDA